MSNKERLAELRQQYRKVVNTNQPIYDLADPSSSAKVCLCGDDDPEGCMFATMKYFYCKGCGEHHRLPIATRTQDSCPVDLLKEIWELQDADE